MTAENGVKNNNLDIEACVLTDKSMWNSTLEDDTSCSCCNRVTGEPANPSGAKVPIGNSNMFVPCESYETKPDLKANSNSINGSYFRKILESVGMSWLGKKSESRKTLTGMYDRI